MAVPTLDSGSSEQYANRMGTVVIENALRGIPELPAPVRRWRVEAGPDATGVDAIWVWATLDDEDLDDNTRSRVRELVRAAVKRACAPESPWVYVRFRGTSEAQDA